MKLDNMEELDEAAQVRLAAQFIFQLADAYCLEPIVDIDAVGITSSSGYMEYDLADAASISVFTVRAYEQGKRMPNDEQRLAVAEALGVPEEVWTAYDIRNANEGFNYPLELHHIFGGYASMIGGKPAWQLSDRLGRSKLDKFVSDWNFAWVELQSTGDKAAYQDWKDHYEG